jgi:TRAP-type mannitol/chloroaromatic compound transport system substrate-binding protein
MANGALVVELFGGDMVVPYGEELFAVSDGIIDAGCNSPWNYLDRHPAAFILDGRSGGLTARQTHAWFRPGMPGWEIAEEFWETEYNVKFIGTTGRTHAETFVHTTVPLNDLSDLQGLKMRAFGDPAEILQRLGVATAFIPSAEIYESMQRGVIDAFEYTTPSIDWTQGFQEIIKYSYISDARAPTGSQHQWVNRDSWNELPEYLQDIVMYAMQSVEEIFVWRGMLLDYEGVKNFQDYGVEVLPLPKDIEDAFIAEALEFYDEKLAEDTTGWFKKIIDAQEEFREICFWQGVS